jgi:hypothetical protein
MSYMRALRPNIYCSKAGQTNGGILDAQMLAERTAAFVKKGLKSFFPVKSRSAVQLQDREG